MTPDDEADLYRLRRQTAELELRAAELRLLTVEAEYRAAPQTLYPQAGDIRLQPPGYETKEHA